jgi:sugar lactone lactonase YvrE
MIRLIFVTIVVVIASASAYFFFWPVPIAPVAWKAPPNPGYSGPFARNTRLKGLVEMLPIGRHTGPESVAVDATGRPHVSTRDGWIVVLDTQGGAPHDWVNTGGEPLGLAFDRAGNLIVADARRGLLSIAPDGALSVLADQAAGTPIRYADDVAVAADGKIYFSDASSKFAAADFKNSIEASVYDLVEHGGHGRLLVYDPVSATTSVLMTGINFANGVAVDPAGQFVLVVETGSYRVLRYWLAGPKRGQPDVFIDQLPSFPDDVTAGRDGRFWVALVSPRSPEIDAMAMRPDARKLMMRMPPSMRPAAKPYGHIIALDATGAVVQDLQDPEGSYAINTSVLETERYLYLGSLVMPSLGRLEKAKIGL